ncbi:MAG: class I SAM-dependent methyltransferase [Bryobacteraceae bacterium]
MIPRALWIVAIATALLQSSANAQNQAANEKIEKERDAWQRASEVVAALRLQPGSVVADLGAGMGYFTARLADAVGARGKVYAVDVTDRSINFLRQRFDKNPAVEVVKASAEEWKPPAPADAALMTDAFHEFGDSAAVLRTLRSYLKEGGRLVIVDFMKPEIEIARAGQRKHHAMSQQIVADDLAAAGFRVVDKLSPFIERTPKYSRLVSRDVFVFVAER